MDDTVICTQCGRENALNPGVTVCPNCDAPLGEHADAPLGVSHSDSPFGDCATCAQQTVGDDALECAACGALTDPVPGAVSFCRHCGALLTTDVE